MTRKELNKLSRAELLERLLEQTRRAEKLSDENARLKERITDRERQLAQAGALAETALRLSGTAESAGALQCLSGVREFAAEAAGTREEGAPDDEEPPQEDRETLKFPDMPTVEQLVWAISRERYKRRYIWSLKTTVYALVTVSAIAVLVAVLLLPVLQIYGASMQPTLAEGDLVVSVKGGAMDTGDIVAFYYNNKILVKRVIAQAGQWVDIAEDGTVYVDNIRIDEPYLTEKAYGECDLELPYQVPESRIFVMGDNRGVSVDSRSTAVGCVAEEQLVGKLVFRVWPLSAFGSLEYREKMTSGYKKKKILKKF